MGFLVPNGGCGGNDGAAFALRTCLDRSIDLALNEFFTLLLYFLILELLILSNRSWLILFLGIVALFTGDIFISDGETLLFRGRRILVLIEWIAFWR